MNHPRIARMAVGVVAVFVVLVAVGAAMLQSSWGTLWIVRSAVQATSGFADATVEAGAIRGNRFSSVEIIDLRVRSGDSLAVFVDTVRVRYRLPALLRKTFVVSDLVVAGPSLEVQGCLGSGDDDPQASSAWTVHIDQGALRGGSMRRGGCDLGPGDWTLNRLDLGVSTVEAGNQLGARLDSLRARFHPPGAPADYEATLFLSMVLEDGRLTVPSLTLESPASRMSGGGVLRYPEDWSSFSDINFAVRSERLALRDVTPFISGLSPDGLVRFDAQLSGSSTNLEVSAGANVLPDGGSLTIESTLGSGQDSGVAYRGVLRATAIEAGQLLASGVAGVVDADFDFDLMGPQLDELTGRMSVTASRVTRTAASSTPDTASAELTAILSQGQGELEGRIMSGPTQATFSGSGRPFGPTKDLSLEGDFTTPVGDISAPGGRLAGSYSVTVAGESLASVSGRGRVDLTPSRIHRADLSEASVRWSLDQGIGEWSLAGAVDAGSLSGEGTIDLRDGVAINLTSAIARELDAAALVGDTIGSSLSGSADFDGRMAAGQPLEVDGHVTLGPSWYGELTLDSTALEMHVRDKRIDAELSTRLLGGSLTATLEGMVGAGGQGRIVRGRLTGLDLGQFASSEGHSTDLSGSLTGEASQSGDGLAGRLSVQLDSSRINRLTVTRASAEAVLNSGTLTYVVETAYPSGMLRVEGDGRPTDTLPAWRITKADFTNLDISALVPETELEIRLSGSLDGSIRGTERTLMSGDLRLDLESATVGGWALRSASAAGPIVDGSYESRVAAEIDGARVESDVTLDFSASATRYRGRGQMEVLDLGRVLSSETATGAIAGAFEFAGEAGGSDGVSIAGSLRVGSGQLHGLSIDSATVVGGSAAGRVTFDTLTVWSPDLLASGTGAFAFGSVATEPSDFTLTASARGPNTFRALLGWPMQTLDEATLDVTATGPADGLVIRAEANVAGLATPTTRLARFQSTGTVLLDADYRLVDLQGEASADSLGWYDALIEGVRLTTGTEGEDHRVTAVVVADERHEGHAEASVRLDSAGVDVILTALRLTGEQEAWALDRESRIRFDHILAVSDFSLSSPFGRVGVSGTIDPFGEQSLRIVAERIRFDALARMSGYGALTGTVDGSIELLGSAASPILASELEGEISLRGSAPQELRTSLLYQDLSLTARGAIRDASGRGAEVIAQVPMFFTLQPADSIDQRWSLFDREALSLELSANDFPLAWTGPFLDQESYRDPAGTLDADIHVRGSRSDPVLSGSASVQDGAVSLPLLGLALEGSHMSARLDGQRVILDEAVVRSGSGRLEATGEIEAQSLMLANLNLNVALEEFDAVQSEFLRTTVNGQLNVGGTTSEPRVTGSLDVLRADLYLGGKLSNGEAEEVELTAADYAMLEERFGYRPSSRDLRTGAWNESWGLGVDVRLGRDTWVRQRASPRLQIQLAGDLQVTKEPGEIESITGTLEAVPQRSYIEQFGRRFDLTRGNIVFNGPPEAARIDIETEYEVPSKQNPDAPEVMIKMGVEGGVDDLSLILSSEPEMENADIVSYLATGRPASQTWQASTLVGGGLVDRGTSLALDRATGIVEGFASESVGLDVVEIRTDGVNGATLIAGRYVAPRLYLGFKQPVARRRSEQSINGGSRAPEIEIEYQSFRWLLLNLQRGGSRIEFFLKSRYAY